MLCLTCQWKVGEYRPMSLSADGSTYVCSSCGTTRISENAPPVLLVRRAIVGPLYLGGFLLLLLATVMFTAFTTLEVPITWTALYSLYVVYFGLAFANFRRKVYA